MSEVKILEELDRLMKQYEQRWGQPVDVSTVSRAFTKEKLCLVLRRIVDTGESTLSGQGDTRFCSTDLGFCRVTVAQRTSSTLRSTALQNPKSEAQNSFRPQVLSFGSWQGNGMRRTGRTPIDVNAASCQKTALGACIPLFTEGIQTGWNHTVECMIRYYERIRPKERRRSCREEGTILGEACPFCKKQVRMWSCGSYGQSHIIRCETAGCMFDTIRGL